MDFSHYTDDPVTLAVDLVNTYGWVSGSDRLTSAEELGSFLAELEGSWTIALPEPVADDVAAIQRLRGQLHQVFEAGDAATAAAHLNEILASNGATPHLSVHGDAPHLHFEPDDGSISRWLGVVTAMGLATVLADQGWERLGICKSDTCEDVYVDTSRNRSRLHCSTTCGTREAVAAHRERQRSAD